MRIEISKSELLFDIRNKSHSDVSVITDAESRYLAEAGTEKNDEVLRDIASSLASLSTVTGRYLAQDVNAMASDTATLPTTLVFNFSFSGRKADGKAQPLANAIHEYLADNTLALFYNSVSQPDLAAKRERLAAQDLQLVDTLVHQKKAPYIIRH